MWFLLKLCFHRLFFKTVHLIFQDSSHWLSFQGVLISLGIRQVCLQVIKMPSVLITSLTPRLLLLCAGGEGKIGKVSDIRGWDSESGRSVAHVTWTCGSTNVYRVGHKGKVDLKYVTPSSGGFYYKDHLPVLGNALCLLVLLSSLSFFRQ